MEIPLPKTIAQGPSPTANVQTLIIDHCGFYSDTDNCVRFNTFSTVYPKMKRFQMRFY